MADRTIKKLFDKRYSVVQKTVELVNRDKYKNNPVVYVLHDITSIPGDLNLSPDFFYAFVDQLTKEGKKFYPIDQIENDLIRKDCDAVFLTFDDGFASAATVVGTYLAEKKIPFVCFVTSGFVGQPSYLSKSQLQSLVTNPFCIIGAHTETHPLLRFQDEVAKIREIQDAKANLESLIGKAVNYFAFPYGSEYAVDKQSIRIAEEAGYKAAFSTFSFHLPDSTDEKWRYHLPRVTVNESFLKL